MRKFYFILLAAAAMAVACESAVDNPQVMDDETYMLDELIELQKGEFDDELFVNTLRQEAFFVDKFYELNDNGEWTEVKSKFNSSLPGTKTLYIFDEATFTLRNVELETNFRDMDDYNFGDYDYSYDAETNTLTTNCKFVEKDGVGEIVVGEKLEAKVLYFDSKMMVLEGDIVSYANVLEKKQWRFVMKFDKAMRENMVDLHDYIAEPQDVDSEAIFNEMENRVVDIFYAYGYSPASDSWSGVYGFDMDTFRLAGDNIVIHNEGFNGEAYEYDYEVPVTRDVESDTLYAKYENPEVGVVEFTFKVIFANDNYVIWLYDMVDTKLDGEVYSSRYLLYTTME